MSGLKHFTVTIRRFDPDGRGHSEDFALPVISPDAEHAVAATMSNCIAFSTKTEGGRPRPLAFRCIDVTEDQ